VDQLRTSKREIEQELKDSKATTLEAVRAAEEEKAEAATLRAALAKSKAGHKKALTKVSNRGRQQCT
jgi:hypothetical protein